MHCLLSVLGQHEEYTVKYNSLPEGVLKAKGYN